mgnify:CR=1 FL=1
MPIGCNMIQIIDTKIIAIYWVNIWQGQSVGWPSLRIAKHAVGAVCWNALQHLAFNSFQASGLNIGHKSGENVIGCVHYGQTAPI